MDAASFSPLVFLLMLAVTVLGVIGRVARRNAEQRACTERELLADRISHKLDAAFEMEWDRYAKQSLAIAQHAGGVRHMPNRECAECWGIVMKRADPKGALRSRLEEL